MIPVTTPPLEPHAPDCRHLRAVWCERCELHLVRCDCGAMWAVCEHEAKAAGAVERRLDEKEGAR